MVGGMCGKQTSARLTECETSPPTGDGLYGKITRMGVIKKVYRHIVEYIL